MHVTVVGAGVIGLSTAFALEERGHEVRVVAAGQGDATTSAVAGAVWLPYRTGPRDRVVEWAARTRRWLSAVAQEDGTAGVDVLTGYEIDLGEELPWWATDDLPVRRERAPVEGAPWAWSFAAPRAQPSRFLPYLAARLRAPIERRRVRSLLEEPGDVVVNCTGLAAGELTGDSEMSALFGQILIADVGRVNLGVTITDARDRDAIFYIIPRREELVLGGCSRPHPTDVGPQVESDLTARILAQAAALGLPVGTVRAQKVGLRPYRPAVRLERDPRHPHIVHNYGHGGAGFTLCRGCAEEVAALLS